jgi:hypothetical protein
VSPERIVCLSGESADICYRLGAADRVAAVSRFRAKLDAPLAGLSSEAFRSIDWADILQPGPGILAGVRQMAGIIERWRR